MQRRNTVLLFTMVAIVALAAVVWRLAANDPAPLPHPGNGGVPAVVPDRVPPLDPAATTPFDGLRVVVTTKLREEYVPPRPSRVQAIALPGGEPLATTMVAGTGANPWADEPRPGVALVKVKVDGGHLVRQVGVEAVGIRELKLGSMLAVTGVVQDEAGRPIVGASVWLGALDGNKPREVETGDDGRFEAQTRASVGVPLVVRAGGYAATWRSIAVDVDVAREHSITLVRDGTLQIQIAGQAENLPLARVFQVPSGPRAAELSRYPFYMQSVAGGYTVTAGGARGLGGLPQRGVLSVAVLHPQVAIGQMQEVELDGLMTQCTVPLKFAPPWQGTISNDAGEPLARAMVLVRPGGRPVHAGSGIRLMPPQLDATGCFFATSENDGSFTVGLSREPGTILSLRALGHAGRDLALKDVLGPDGTLTEPLWLPVWTGGDLVLRLLPPAENAAWRAEFDVGGGTILECEAGKVAVVSLPHYGMYDFTVATYMGSEKLAEREYRGVSATGPVDVPAPPAK